MRVQRVQTGVRLEKRLLKVLKSLAAYLDMSLGDLLEGIIKISDALSEKVEKIEQLKAVYEMDYGAEASHKMVEDDEAKG